MAEDKFGSESHFTSEYGRLTEKYRGVMSLKPNQIVAKTWISSIVTEEAKKQEQERILTLDDKKIAALQSVIPFSKGEVESLSFDKLYSLYVGLEMIETDVASGLFEFVQLKSDLESIETVPVDTPNMPNPPAFATVVTFKPESKILHKILSSNKEKAPVR